MSELGRNRCRQTPVIASQSTQQAPSSCPNGSTRRSVLSRDLIAEMLDVADCDGVVWATDLITGGLCRARRTI